MSPSAIDHLIAAFLVLVVPWLVVVDDRRMITSGMMARLSLGTESEPGDTAP